MKDQDDEAFGNYIKKLKEVKMFALEKMQVGYNGILPYSRAATAGGRMKASEKKGQQHRCQGDIRKTSLCIRTFA